MNKIRFVCICFYLLLAKTNGFAQQHSTTVALKTILAQISEKHQIKFSYLDESIQFVKIEPIAVSLSLSEKISIIEKQTGLRFRKISKRYYSVFENKTTVGSHYFKLIDSETAQPVENAVIEPENKSFQLFSDSSGYFKLSNSLKNNRFSISHQGFETQVIELKDSKKNILKTIDLVPKIKALDEVIAQRYLTSGIYKKNTGSVLIKPRKFGILPGLIDADVLQTMQQIPGITSLDESIANITIRGGTHDQNLFLWNGIRMYQTGHFFGLISAFNPATATQMMVTKNGTSAFFGESVSGLVEMSTDLENKLSNHTIFNTNLISCDVFSRINLNKKSSVNLSARRSFTDFFSSPTYKNYADKIFQNTIITQLSNQQPIAYANEYDFYFYDASLQYHYKIDEKSAFSLNLIGIKNHLNVLQKTATESEESTLEQSNFGASATFSKQWNASNRTELLGYVSNYGLNSKNESIENNEILNQKNEVLEINLKLKHTLSFNRNQVSFGYQVYETGVKNVDQLNEPFYLRSIKNVLTHHAFIIENEYNSKQGSTKLVTGLRTNYIQKLKKTYLEPRLQLNHKINSKLNLEVLGELKSQSVSQIIDLQKDFLGIEKRRWIVSNDSIIPVQKSIQTSIGLTFNTNKWLVTLESFYKKVSGITSGSQGFQNQFEFTKSNGNYTVVGGELLIQKTFHQFNSWLSYSFNQNKYRFDELYAKNFPNNYELSHYLSWAGIYEWKQLKFALGAKWHTGKPYTLPKNNNITLSEPTIVYNSPNSAKLEDFFQMNFSVSKKWIVACCQMEATFSILNLLNTQNPINRYYQINTANNTVESVDSFALKMTPNLGLKFKI